MPFNAVHTIHLPITVHIFKPLKAEAELAAATRDLAVDADGIKILVSVHRALTARGAMA